jgi:predicted Rdx family selenoprotein
MDLTPRVVTDQPAISLVDRELATVDTTLHAVATSAPAGSFTVDIRLGGETLWSENRIGGSPEAVAEEALRHVARTLRDVLAAASRPRARR